MKIKRFSFAILFSLTALCSCTDDGLESVPDGSSDSFEYSEQLIELTATVDDTISSTDTSTKGTPITDGEKVNSIGIFTNVRTYSGGNFTDAKVYLSNSEVARNTYGILEFLNMSYWPILKDTQTLGFIAYSPYSDVTYDEDGVMTTTSTTTESGISDVTSTDMLHLQLNYNVPTDVANQPDLLVSLPVEQTEDAVSLTFKHALSTIVFKVQGDGVMPVKSITFTDIGYQAQMTLTYDGNTVESTGVTTYTGTPVWSYIEDEDGYPTTIRDMELSIDAGTLVEVYPDEDLEVINAASGYLMMIPQTVSASSKIVIEFTDNETRSVRFLDKQEWIPGGKYNYNINIAFEGEVVDFSDIETVNTLVGNPDGTELETANCYILNPPVYTKEQELGTDDSDDSATTTSQSVFTRVSDTRSDATETIYGALYYIPITSRINDYYVEYVDGGTFPSISESWKPQILWYDCNKDPEDEGIVIKRAAASDDGEERFSVYVPYGYNNPGNITVGVMSTSGEIVWSWHLWITDYNPYYNYTLGYDAKATGESKAYAIDVEGGELHHYRDTENFVSNYWNSISYYRDRLIMDRNLGAWNAGSASYSTTDKTPGLFYQFGRKDPMPRGAANYTNVARQFEIVGSTTDMLTSIENPLTFYGGATYWCTDTESDRVWGDKNLTGAKDGEYYKSIFDPSPIGFVVPTLNVWSDFYYTSATKTSAPASSTITRSMGISGISYVSEYGLEALYPLSGYLASGALTNGNNCCYWASRANSTSSSHGTQMNYTYSATAANCYITLYNYTYSVTTPETTYTGDYSYKAYGNLVRPMQRWYGDLPSDDEGDE